MAPGAQGSPLTRLLPDPPSIVPTCPVGLDPAIFELPERPAVLGGLCPAAFRELPSLVRWVDRLPEARFDEGLEAAWAAWTWWRESPWYKVVPLIPQVPCSPNIRAVDLVGQRSRNRPDVAAYLNDIHIGFCPPGWRRLATNRQLLGRISTVTKAQSNAMRQAQRELGLQPQTWYHQTTETRTRDHRGVSDLHGVFRGAKPPHEPWASTLPPDVLVSTLAPYHVPGKRGILFLDPQGSIRYWT